MGVISNAEWIAAVNSPLNAFGAGNVLALGDAYTKPSEYRLIPVEATVPKPGQYQSGFNPYTLTPVFSTPKPKPSFFQATVEGVVSGVVNAAQFYANPVGYVVNSAVQYNKEKLDMSLNLGGLLGGVGSVIGGIGSGNYLSAIQGGLGVASSFFPQPSSAPVYSPTPQYNPNPYGAQAQPVGAFAVPAAAAAAMMSRLAPILTKIAVKLGMKAKPSLNRAMEIIRKTAKLLGSPEAVAVALGITTAELAQLITTSQARKRRRMNPANSRALRRAARRIKSFHKLCSHTDILRSRGRRHAAPVYNFQRRKKCA